jgi:hypothetical protein
VSAGPQGLVFRSGVSWLSQTEMANRLAGTLAEAMRAPDQDARAALVRALIGAGALECALADSGDPLAARAMEIADAVASAAFGADRRALPAFSAEVESWRSPAVLRQTVPEGFAYYALAPLAFGEDAAAQVTGGPVTVVGIRTIGTTLSAAAKAALLRRGLDVDRLTLRPQGHAYDRRLPLDPQARTHIERRRAVGALFLVVDEGPGLSGSTFLSVAEAIETLGVPRDRILLFGSRSVDPKALVAPDGARRWRRFASTAARPRRPDLASGGRDLAGGQWRALLWPSKMPAPPSWPAMERLKALAPDSQSLLKFEGLGHHGEVCRARASTLAAEDWTVEPEWGPDEHGLVRYPFVQAVPLHHAQRTSAVLRHIGRYLAARARLLPAQPTQADTDALAEMVQVNLALELGEETHHPPPLFIERPALVDGRLQPHEWLREKSGSIVKVDAVSHGDDHFFPGPTDIAWDLAGAAVEWELGPEERETLVSAYQAASGDDPRLRLPGFEVAYAAFRARYALMAAHASPVSETSRWRAAHARYQTALRAALKDPRFGPRLEFS